jgi:hypothetical protein
VALEVEIRTYEAKLEELKKHHSGKFVVIHGDDVIGAFDTFENAASDAVLKFGRGPYLIRQVDAPEPSMPMSWLYRPTAV